MIRPARFALIAALVLPLVSAACIGAGDPNVKQLSYADQPRIELDVAQVEITQAFESADGVPQVDKDFTAHPVTVIKSWANDRLDPDGNARIARLTIRDASAVRTVFETDKTLVGLVTTETGERVDANVDVLLEILDDRGKVLAYASARSERSRMLPENLDWVERQKVYFDMSKALMDDINVSLESSIREHFREYVL